ncbi:MAG: hypothetical protein HEQ22_03225 [Sphingopyxis sp.]|uniref:hypothetical protein n=1 Tax=Sphingopyxis sp. TaxID=1908224 RepID=UPI003D810E4D
MTDQSEGWRAGDLAVCVKSTAWWTLAGQPAPGPALDQVLWVAAVYEGVALEGGVGTALEFREFANELYPAAPYFRKVQPDHSAADDAEFVALIRRVSVGASA